MLYYINKLFSWRIFIMKDYILQNIKELNSKSARKNPMPSLDELSNLKVGDLVKLSFILNAPLSNPNAERMWVIVKEISNDTIIGELNNEPYNIKSIKCGDTIQFSTNNIVSIWDNSLKDVNLDKFAIITKRAWEHKEINYATKIDQLLNENDSGWQLFYGDEDEQYLMDEDNTSLIPLGAVLQFEPLFEKVLLSNAKVVSYSDSMKSFVEVPEFFY